MKRVNVIDLIIVLIVLAVASTGYIYIKSKNAYNTQSEKVRYKIRIENVDKSIKNSIKLDNLNDYKYVQQLGKIIKVESNPYYEYIFDPNKGENISIENKNNENLIITIEANCEKFESGLFLSKSYDLKIGRTVYAQGSDFNLTGKVIYIEQ